MKHQGNLIIKTQEDAEKYSGVTEVTGNVCIYSEAKLDALKYVGGYVYINSKGKLDAPELESVGGHVSIFANAKLGALKSVGGNVYIYSEGKLDAPNLESVGGNVSICSSAKLDALKSVGGYVSIYSEAKLDALKSVGGNVSIYSEAKLDALKHVGGDVYINSNAVCIHANGKLDAPELESVGGDVYIYSEGKLDAPELYPEGFDNFKVYDGIPCVVLSSKKKDGIEILNCRLANIKQQKLVGGRFFIAKKGNKTAHAEDIKTALEELQFKLGDRDVSQYKNMPMNTRKSPKDWAFVYRMITGACQYGTQHFMESKGKLKKTYTLSEILEETKGAYGHETFRKAIS